MRRRASNVYGRPVFLARVGGIAFALTLIAFAFLARSAARAEGQGASHARSADTMALAMAEKRSAERLRDAENALATARAQRRASAMQRDEISPEIRARRDTLAAATAELTRLLERSDDAPLVASFRALGTAPSMAGEPRVARLLDSLN